MNFAELVLTLTVACGDDSLGWTPTLDETRLVYGGTSIVLSVDTSHHPIGCWEGTVRVTHSLDGEESEPAFFWWEQVPGTMAIGVDATGRFMEWDIPCSIGELGDCIRWGGARNKCREREAPVCPTIGAW